MNYAIDTNSLILYRRLLQYVKPYWKVFALAVLGMIAIAATEPIFPAIMKYLLDHGFKTPNSRLVWVIPLSIMLLFLVKAVLSFCTNYMMMWINAHLIADIRTEVFAKVLTLPTQLYQDESSSRLISRLVYDVSALSEAATNAFVTLIRESFTTLALLIYLLYLDWRLTLITLTIAPVITLIVKGFSQRVRALSRQNFEAGRKVAHAAEESINGHKVIKIFGGQAQQGAWFAQCIEGLRRATMKEATPASATTPMTHLAASIMVAVIVYLALSQSSGQSGATTAGSFISFITAMLMLMNPLKQLATVSTTLQRGLAACESVFGLLDASSEPDFGTIELTNARGDIAFENVSFSYPNSEKFALSNISFQVKSGQTLALVGASGGGKTTIGALLPRFFNVAKENGRITIDGVDIHNLTLTSLRHNIALVSQDVVLFNSSVRANITFGLKTPCSDENLSTAAKAANAWEFISQLPDGLDTVIGEDGAKLSGGQRQRIAIARALLKNAPILILDEATSALDTESERQVQQALATLMQNRTTIIIAHRLSTIEHADRILVLNQGRIVESGTHAELMTANGYYAKLNQTETQV